jgi:hypothetical protein
VIGDLFFSGAGGRAHWKTMPPASRTETGRAPLKKEEASEARAKAVVASEGVAGASPVVRLSFVRT